MAAKELVESVRRRLQWQIVCSQALVALSIGAGGLVLLLILGTQVLDWYWPVVLAVGSFGYLLWKVWNRLPGDYAAAQVLDRRLGTADLFAAAHYFRTQPERKLSRQLLEQAEQEAVRYRAADAVPFGMPRGWAAAAALSVAALSLLVVRYAFQSSLDLAAPIAPGMYELLASGEKPTQMAKAKTKGPDGQPLEGVTLNDLKQQGKDEQGVEKGQELNTEGSNSSESATAGQKPGQFQQAMQPSEEGEQMEGAEKGDASAPGDKDSKGEEGSKDGDKKGGAAEKKTGAPQNQGNQQGEKNSLLDKFKDAMANMMNKLKSQDKGEGQQQQAQNKQDGQQQGGGQQQQSKQGQQAASKQQAGGQQQSDQNGQQQGEGADKGQQQQAKGGDKANQSPSGDQKSGTGKQDGSKDVQLAEQQQAMGKISEVFGKRAQNLQGEIMIEVSSSKSQALKTGYSGKTAEHTDSSGVIHRDEVPLIHQNYVQKYFEELRKSPAPKAKTP